MRKTHWLFLLALPAALLLAGCKSEESKAPAVKQYTIKGKVIAIDPNKRAVKLDHEDIPGLMKGMPMFFDVADAKLLDGLKEGDDVEGQLKVESGQYTITELKKR